MSLWKTRTQTDHGRIGEMMTRKGSLQTPFFMPDATRASVRGLTREDLETVGVEALVVNTYHLMLQPGEALIKEAGDIHAFMDWQRPVLSDSGGYQVYSLIHKNPDLGRITEEGAEFRSVLDGSKYLLTPERSIQIQFDLGVDMMVVLDDPRPNDASEEEIVKAVDRTLRWARRCRDEYDAQVSARGLTDENRPLLFGVVQGGMMVSERQRCAEGLVAIGFDGYGLGGRHVDMEGKFLGELVAAIASFIPEDSIRFALGVGTPEDIVRCHAVGWDMFDCVIPTREGRHGRLFLWKNENTNFKTQKPNESTALPVDFYETINIKNEQFTSDFTAVDPTCDCTLCTKYTRAYLKHLLKVGEPLALRLASEHNLRFYMRLMEQLRLQK
ncbi:MAG: tRNA guanosine(34) transglycosylase Tgt [Candidatus Moraniibacteriota bacterium]